LSRRTLAACALAFALITTSCGGDPAEPAATTTAADASAFPREVAGVTIPARPERIVSASATHTEILYALGAGDRIAAVDLFSDHPQEAADKEKVDSFNVNVEALAAFDPDLVILAYDPGDVAAGLGRLGIPTLLFPTAPATLEEAFAEWEIVGEAIDAGEEAEALVSGVREEMDEIVSTVPETGGDPLTYYHELGGDLFTVTSDTFAGHLYSLIGLENVADAAAGAVDGYVQLSPEYLLEADPDLVFLADTVCCGQSAETVAARPGWDTLSAVETGRVIELDDDVASRWGPRVVEFLETITGAAYPGTG